MSDRFNKAIAAWAKNASVKSKFQKLYPMDQELFDAYVELQMKLREATDRKTA